MATVGVPSVGECLLGAGIVGSLGDAIQLVAQGLARMQEVIRLQTEEALLQQEQRLQEAFDRQLQEALRQRDQMVEERLQQQALDADARTARVSDAVVTLSLKLDEVNQEVDERLAELQLSHFARGAEDEVEEERQGRLDSRMQKLETSVDRALQCVFPRVEALLVQLEKPSAPRQHPLICSREATPSPSPSPARARSADCCRRRTLESSPVGECPRPPGPKQRPNENRKQLLEAAREGRIERVRELLDGGANINFTDSSGWTALMWAAKKAHANLVALLIDKNADVNALTDKNSTALHAASFHDHSGLCVKLLIGAGANVHCRNRTGRQPLHYAVLNSNVAAVQALMLAGADRTVKDSDGHSPLDAAKTDAIRQLVHF